VFAPRTRVQVVVSEGVAQADNAGEVYQESTRLSSQVTVSHCESGSFGATRDLR
jgi:hypothetical protein